MREAGFTKKNITYTKREYCDNFPKQLSGVHALTTCPVEDHGEPHIAAGIDLFVFLFFSSSIFYYVS